MRFVMHRERGRESMKPLKRVVVLVAVLGLVAAACGGGETEEGGEEPTGGEIQSGGTLELALLADVEHAYDPGKEYSALSFEFFRCCLTRTLYSTNGLAGPDGGAELQPDLAEGDPEVSADGLTYTFTIKSGVHYSPPLEDVEVTAQDFARALMRESDPQASAEGYSFYYSESGGFGGIVGFDKAEGGPIEGVETPDDHTLVITLNQPSGDFPWRMTMPATAPIPPNPDDPDAPLGIAEGHTKDFGRFLVGTGPYMFAGAADLDFSVPADEQEENSGYVPGRSYKLIRNPSWVKDANDELRPAYVDEINVQIGGTTKVLSNAVDTGEIDMELDGVPPAEQIRAYQADPEREDQVHSNPSDGVRYIALNIAEPPFDDIHVRKALSLVMDKDGLRRTRGGELFGDIAGHFIIPSLLGGELEGYDPYATPNSAGDVEAAMEEMKQSAYDSDQDGICDDPVCEGILTPTDSADPYPAQNPIIVDAAKKIGLELDVRSGDRYTFMYDKCLDPASHWGVCPSVGWFKDFPDAVTWGPLFTSASIGPAGCCNYSLVGASPDFLKENGYTVTDVPSVDDQFSECAATPVGAERYTCFAELDRTIMEDIVPVIPFLFDNDVDLVGDRLVNYTYDQSAGLMSLDHVALAGGGA
jgi:peptide/nickel transport system substrate-binding protein